MDSYFQFINFSQFKSLKIENSFSIFENKTEIQQNLHCPVAEDSSSSELSTEQKPEQEHDKITDEGRKLEFY